MSAYMVDRSLIRYLLSAAMRLGHGGTFHWYHNGCAHELPRSDYERAAEVGQMLWNENRRSVEARYPNCTPDDLPGPIGETYVYDHHRPFFGRIDPVQVLKSIACLDYQSCEHPEWRQSQAHAFLRSLEHEAIRNLPGYEAAAWGAPNMLAAPAGVQ